MFLSDLRAALARFWYVALLGVIVAVGCGYAVSRAVPVTYEARALILLLPPKSMINIGGNPYLALGGLDPAAAVLGRAMMDSETAEDLDELAPEMEYVVEPDASTSGPVLMAVVESRTADGTLRALNRLIDGFAPRFEQMQRDTGAPTRSLITVTLVTKDTEATTLRKDQLRAVLAVTAIVLVGALGTVVLADRLLDRPGGRDRRRRARPEDGLTELPEHTDETPPDLSGGDDVRPSAEPGGAAPSTHVEPRGAAVRRKAHADAVDA